MKTSKQMSQEIFEKIARREARRQDVRKRVKRIFAGAIVLCFLLPVAVYYTTTEELNHSQPLTFEFEEKTPFDPDVTPFDSTETYQEYAFSLQV